MSYGTSPGVRKFEIILKDAVKCGYNTVGDSEVTFPAQDYSMVSGFESTCKNFAVPAKNLEDISLADDMTGNPVQWKIPYTSISNSVTVVFYKPIVMHYFVMNPSNSTICLDVSVWAWRKGFSNRNPFNGSPLTLEEMVLHYLTGVAQASTVTGIVMEQDEKTLGVVVPPKIHNFALTANPGSIALNENALKLGVDQVFPIQSLRKKCVKRLSTRKCVSIPPGQIYKFKVMYRMPQGLSIDAFTGGAYPEYCGLDRFVMLKWSTQMGTVGGFLESAHLSEKIHIVVGRQASIKGTMVQRIPTVKCQLVYSHDGPVGAGTDYIGEPVGEHTAIMEVTKSAQQIEQVP